jgi:hypothetical protein
MKIQIKTAQPKSSTINATRGAHRDSKTRRRRLGCFGGGAFTSGIGLGWLIRTWTYTASTGPSRVAAAVIITAMIIATLIQFSVVIYPALLKWRDVRKREAYITNAPDGATR